ncbi:MAG: CPBP family intramembrane glutamic endopeptidase [Terriglobia bacterium]
MNTERVFFAEGNLRPIWRFLLSIPMVLLAIVVAEALAGFAFAGAGHRGAVFAAQVFALALLLAAFKLLTSLLDRRPLGSVGLAFCGRWHLEFGMGLGIGTLMILSVGALEQFLGMAHFAVNSASPGQFAGWGVGLLVFLFVAATDEELIYRGYPFQRLVDALGPGGAVVLFAGAFGLVHLRNPDHTWLSTLNTMLVGVPLAVAYLRTRALWLPVGIHLAWNYVQGCGLGLPVSGIRMPFSFFRAEGNGSELLTGGPYGPEGGLLATGVIVAATVYLSLSRSIYISREMRALVFGPAPVAASAAEAVVPREVSTVQANADQLDLK